MCIQFLSRLLVFQIMKMRPQPFYWHLLKDIIVLIMSNKNNLRGFDHIHMPANWRAINNNIIKLLLLLLIWVNELRQYLTINE